MQLVIKYPDDLGKTKLLTPKLLSIKLAMFFALCCPERVSSLWPPMLPRDPWRSFSLILTTAHSLKKCRYWHSLPRSRFLDVTQRSQRYVTSKKRLRGRLVLTLRSSRHTWSVEQSTTAVVNSNVPLEEVMKMADWSRISTFQKFYYNPVFKSNYGHSVLK